LGEQKRVTEETQNPSCPGNDLVMGLQKNYT